MMEIEILIYNLRKRINDYKDSILYDNKALKQGTLSIEIAICLFELSFYCGRKIEESEKYWFTGRYYISYDFTGEWEDLAKMYDEIVKITKERNFFKENSS
jgi:hypothetical protein